MEVKKDDNQEESSVYFREGMTSQEYFEMQVDKSNAFEEPFVIERPDLEKIKLMCALCQIVEEGFCCPEHCCDVSF